MSPIIHVANKSIVSALTLSFQVSAKDSLQPQTVVDSLNSSLIRTTNIHVALHHISSRVMGVAAVQALEAL